MDPVQPQQVPPKTCMITLMFAVDTDEEAMAMKKHIDEHTKGIKDKRYTFQINER